MPDKSKDAKMETHLLSCQQTPGTTMTRQAMRNLLRSIFSIALASFTLTTFAAPSPGPSISARLASCDSTVVRAAAGEMLRDPTTLQEPVMLFAAATGERIAGNKEEAAFFFLAARLRTARQALFEKGDRPQLIAVFDMTAAPLIMPAMEADPELRRRVMQRVVDWDRSTPDPYRDRPSAESAGVPEKLAEIDAALMRLLDRLPNDPERLVRARDEDAQAEQQTQAIYASRCGPGMMDAVEAEAATSRIKREAEDLVRTHPLVVRHAGGAVKSLNVGTWRQDSSGVPSRLTVSVRPAVGRMFYAEVDAEVTVAPDRKLASVKVSMACITDPWIGKQDARWKDVCRDDPGAILPSSPQNEEDGSQQK